MLLTQHGLRRQQAELPVGVYADILILLETERRKAFHTGTAHIYSSRPSFFQRIRMNRTIGLGRAQSQELYKGVRKYAWP